MSLIVKPDQERAKEFLDRVSELMTSAEVVLVHKPDCIVLAVYDPMRESGHEWRAVAKIKSITPTIVDWSPITWRADELIPSRIV
jgi:hypothetical protein